MLVNISQACKLAGISRTVFYENYIKKGKISTTKDKKNRPAVDTSEILRVFGGLQTVQGLTDKVEQGLTHETLQPVHNLTPNEHTIKLAQLQAENAQLLARLEEAKEREQWQRGQIEKLTDTIKLLEAPRTAKPATLKQWWKSFF